MISQEQANHIRKIWNKKRQRSLKCMNGRKNFHQFLNPFLINCFMKDFKSVIIMHINFLLGIDTNDYDFDLFFIYLKNPKTLYSNCTENQRK